MDTTQTTAHVSLCAGYGGIDLGLKRAIPSLRTIAFSEIEAFACANLVAKMEAGLLDPAPIWSNLKTFPWDSFRGKVDILSGGYPCQPFSAAGKRLGAEDPRHLWPSIADGIARMRPRMCFFENVEGHISLGLRDVIEDLGRLGYRTTWGIFSASEVGAPHQRKRVFIFAYRDSERGQLPDWWRVTAEQVPVGDGEARRTQWPSRPGEQQHGWEPPRVVANTERGRGEEPEHLNANLPSEPSGCGAKAMGNAKGERPREARGFYSESSGRFAGHGETMGNAAQREDNGREPRDMEGEAGEGRCGDHAADGTGEVLGDTKNRTRLRTAPRATGHVAFADEAVEPWQAQPPLGRDADGSADRMDDAELFVSCDNRTDELRLLGNGVVPQTAERAFRVLAEELGLIPS